jgi:hypothetical protein
VAKRFIDSDIWSDPWFQDLDLISKIFWIYLFTNCDIIGIWEYNPKRAEFDIGKSLPWENLKKVLSEKVGYTEKMWVIKSFIAKQYPNILKKPHAPLHIAVLNEIEKKGLNLNGNSLSIDYRYTIDRVQVIVKEKVKEKEEVKEEEKEGFTCPDHLLDLWPDYLITRKQKKAAKTDSALQRIIEKLETLAPGDNAAQHEILQKSIDSGWIDVYELKDNFKRLSGQSNRDQKLSGQYAEQISLPRLV